MSRWTVSLLLCQFHNTCISFCLRDVIMDCETVYIQMLSLLFKGWLCGLYHFFCASDTCISPLFKFSSVQDGIFALKKAHMHSTSVQDGIYALKKSPYAFKFSSRWYLCAQKNPYVLHPVCHSLRGVCGMCHMLLCQFINTMHFPAV